jgi:arylsulfatase A-like enzyme
MRIISLLTLFLLASSVRAADTPRPPNIVVILSDDVGYGDLGCYGATKIKTPNLDKLAASGMRFTDAHSPAAVCTPTRYALMTGQYAWRNKAGSSILSGVAPLSIDVNALTLPGLLKANGYATAAVGKWHLGLGNGPTDYNAPIKPGAREVGFDYSFLIPATGDRVPCVYVEDGKVGDEPTGAEDPKLLTKMRPSHGHDNTIVNGISRIGWMTGGKAALWKDEDMADDLTSRAVKFIAASKEKPFFLYFATHDVHVPRLPHPRFKGTSGCGLRGDSIQQLDWCVGEVLAELDKHKLTENTLVIFTSDNGGVMDDGYVDGSGDDKSGHKCNGDVRGFKGGLYEGGHRIPFIARWPGHVPVGKVSRELICHVDFLATAAAILNKPLEKDDGPDSFSFLPALLNEKPEKPCRETLVLQAGYVAGKAFRQGPWVMISDLGKKGSKPELYNLRDDFSQEKNLAPTNPEKVAELAELLRKARESSSTRPKQ